MGSSSQKFIPVSFLCTKKTGINLLSCHYRHAKPEDQADVMSHVIKVMHKTLRDSRKLYYIQ